MYALCLRPIAGTGYKAQDRLFSFFSFIRLQYDTHTLDVMLKAMITGLRKGYYWLTPSKI